jgi:hypothetical protein
MNMTPKFNLGEHVWYARIRWLSRQAQCPDCFGKRFLTVILGDDSQVTVECTGCREGCDPPRGTIQSHDFEIDPHFSSIKGIRKDIYEGKPRLEYTMEDCSVLYEENMFETLEEARLRSEVLLAEHREAEKLRLLKKEKDTRSWAWNASYHRGCIRNAERDLAYHKSKLAVALEYKKAGTE